MSSLMPLFRQLVSLVDRPDKPTPEVTVAALALDMKAATVTRTARGDFAVIDARRSDFPHAPGLAIFGDSLRRSITLALEGDDRCPYSLDLMTGLPIRIQQSRMGDGFAATATLGEFDVGCTVSNEDQRLQTIFCETRRKPLDIGEAASRELSAILLRQTAELDTFLGGLKAGQDEFNTAKAIVGKVLGEMYVAALYPIFEKYPHLKPDGFP